MARLAGSARTWISRFPNNSRAKGPSNVMKDSKSILLLVVSVLLLLVSFALLWTWGYQFSSFTKDKSGTVYVIKDSTATANATRDSLRRIYTSTIEGFKTLDSTWVKADSLRTDLDVKLNEFYKLRTEIAELLKNPVSKADLELAKRKIDELQARVESLRSRNNEVEQENKRLLAMIEQMRKGRGETGSSGSGGTSVNLVSPSSSQPNSGSSILSATDIRFNALIVDQGREMETNEAFQTDKISGSFLVKNNNMPMNSAEVYVVVLQPNGKVLQNSAWDAGTFQTNEGRKIYSCKLRFDYAKGESKKLSFNLAGDQFPKGNYTLQLYHNGVQIGKTVKSLM